VERSMWCCMRMIYCAKLDYDKSVMIGRADPF
jgi:hypothetical protein